MNKQSNVYTVVYIIVLVIVVGAALAFTAMGLKPRQIENVNADKMKQILASVLITPAKDSIATDFNHYITEQLVVNDKGQKIGDDAFSVNVSVQSKIVDMSKRELPVYVCTLSEGDVKYIVPLYGTGLWGPIWGYVSFNSDGSTIYGAYFAHEGETPGLGAEIEKPAFSSQFEGKRVFKDGKFLPIEVVKGGVAPVDGADYVDGISGGTITSKGVGAMLSNCLEPYQAFLQTLSTK
ncbi:MAG: NADH:ubiquinone reductase (Na(+)-transporting) subunit C [Bacteroidales bacterium]|nr:NADH:ubiquinone reductase (Na(+)-transporting) subunit C [Bacteroidales bacterium]MCD8394239.1 NADH:ubiquinone reductase (Na(+)-transporting) subunit C [Bacteroidales bacterium]